MIIMFLVTAMGYMGLFGMIADLGMSPLFQNAFF